VLDRTITVNGQALTIVGVTSRGFQGLTLGVQPKVFVPVALAGEMVSWLKDFPERTGYWLYLFARLRPGVPESQAESAINRVYRPIIQEVEVPLQKGAGMSDRQLAEFRNRVLELKDASRGQSLLDDQVRTPLVLLFAITGIVLLIACANIANLLLARGASRRTEMAVRLSLGASRRHVVAQLLTESCVLAFLGGAAGLLVARGTLWSVRSILPLDLAGPLDFRLSTPVVLFTMALSLATGLLFGVFPALHGTRAGLIGSIRAGTGQIAEARGAARFRGSMVVVQIALSLVLLISAGLFLKSLRNVVRAELGIRTDHVVTFRLSPELNGYPERKSRQFFERMEEDLAALPGVTSVTAATVSLFSGFSNGSGVIRMEGVRAGPGATSVGASFNLVGPQYFRTLGIPILAGRELTAVDRDGAPKVAVVNEAFAKQFGLGRDIVGKRFNPWGGEELDVEIVGVARDTKYSEVKGKVPPTFFLAVRQMPNIGSLQFYVRTSGDPAALVRRVPGAVAGVDPRLPVEGLETLPQQVRESVVLDRMVSTFSSGYAMLATLLAAVGLYGVLAYTVAQRTREIGVRVALGADGRRVRLMVLRQVGWMLLLGSGIGVAAALGLGRWAGSLLYGLTSYDPVVILTALLTISLVALGAGYLPARRASRVSPMEALRAE
jgi:predicted permease